MASINGFTVVPYGDPLLKTYTVPGSDTRLSVRAEIAPILIGFAADFHRYVEPLNPKSCWGHAPRKIAGTDSWSFHAPGIAEDLNASAHPMGVRGTFSADEVRAIRGLLKKYSYNGVQLLRWGGDYINRADDMHFEIIVDRTTALAAVKALQNPPAPKPSLPAPLLVDGKLGPKTIGRWQRIMGTPVDWRITEPSYLVKAVQCRLNTMLSGIDLVVDGEGIRQDGKRYKTVYALQRYLGTERDGIMSTPVSQVVKALQRRLNTGKF